MSGLPARGAGPPAYLSHMTFAIAVALGLLVVTAVAGTAVALSGATEAGWLIWITGGIASAGIVLVEPWLIAFWCSEDPDGT